MSITENKIIDFMGIDISTNEVKLFIADHLDWSDAKGDHMFMLQDKINEYLAFIESGELLQEYPKAKGKKAIIQVTTVTSYNAHKNTLNILNEVVFPSIK